MPGLGTQELKIRGHHLLCMLGFRGLGYSDGFVRNMRAVVEVYMAAPGAVVEVVACPDAICSACPHLVGKGCARREGAEERIGVKDTAVLDALGLTQGARLPAERLRRLVAQTFAPADLEVLCAECSWRGHGYCAEGLRRQGEDRGGRSPTRRRGAFTLAELLVVIGIVTVLAGLMVPAIARARGLSRRTQCTSRLRQVGIGFQGYWMDNRFAYPCADDPVSTSPHYWLWMGRGWRSFIAPYLEDTLEVLYCPADETAPQQWESTSFGYSMAFYHTPGQIAAMTTPADTYSNPVPGRVQRTSQVAHPTRKVLAAEWLSNHQPLDDDPGWWGWEGSRNCLFADGHVEYRAARSIEPANDGLPDFNLTVGGIRGVDVD